MPVFKTFNLNLFTNLTQLSSFGQIRELSILSAKKTCETVLLTNCEDCNENTTCWHHSLWIKLSRSLNLTVFNQRIETLPQTSQMKRARKSITTKMTREIFQNDLERVYHDEYAYALLLNNLPPCPPLPRMKN